MSTANDVLDFKGHDLWTIDANSTVHEATQLMEDRGIGALPVSEGGSPLAGVLSERDCARATILRGLPADTTKVAHDDPGGDRTRRDDTRRQVHVPDESSRYPSPAGERRPRVVSGSCRAAMSCASWFASRT